MTAHLKRTLTLIPLTLFGVGTILGAGIYVIISEVAAEAGPLFPLSFVVSAIVALLSSLSYAELSSRFPKSGGEAVYVEKAFASPIVTILTGYGVIFTGVLSAATILKGFYGYFALFFPISEFLCLSIVTAILCAIAVKGIRESVIVVALITIIEIFGLLLVVWFGAPQVLQASYSLPIGGGMFGAPVFLGAFVAYFAFVGFEDIVNMAEETVRPEVTVPRAVFLALIISSVIYFAVAVSVQASLPLEDIVHSRTPLALVLERYSGLSAKLLGLIAMVSIINGALVQIIMVSRISYGMAKLKKAPAIFAQISDLTKTPAIGTILVSLLVWGMAVSVDIGRLARHTSFVILFVFLLVNASLVQIKRKKSGDQRAPFTVSIWVPIVGTIVCFFLLVLYILV